MSHSHLIRRLLFSLVTIVLLAAGSALADNWPQFRGENFNAVSTSKLPVKWSDVDGKMENVRWKIPMVGEGWSQPVVWNQKVILTAAVPVDPADRDATKPQPYTGQGGKSREDLNQTVYNYDVICLNTNSGEEVWHRSVKQGPPPIPRHSTNTYATETPITDGERIYAYFGMNGIYCLDMDGNVLWEKDLGVYQMRADWGTASSPVLGGDKVFVQIDNEVQSFVIALDSKTGNEVWRVDRDEKSQYSSPMVWKNSVREELICGGMIYRSYDLATGDLLWQLDMAKGRSSATPLAANDRLYIGTELRNRGGSDDGGGRLFCVKPGGDGDITPKDDAPSSEFIQWRIDRSDIQMASPTICDGNLYLFQRSGSVMHCVDAATGESEYRKRVTGAPAFWASPWTDGEHVYTLAANGTTFVLAGGDEFEIVSENVLGQQTWGTPALANGRIYLRTVDHLYCIEESASP